MASKPHPETAVARHVVNWLAAEHWEVHEEVACGSGVSDIVALRRVADRVAPVIRCIEVKTSLTAELVEQAVRARYASISHTVEVAFPASGGLKRTAGQRLLTTILHREGIGVIRVNMTDEQARWSGRVEVERAATFTRSVERSMGLQRMQWLTSLRRTRATLAEHVNLVPAGTNRGGAWSPYKGTMMAVREIIERRGEATMAEIMAELPKHHYHTDASAKSTIPTALQLWESDWCVAEKRGGRFVFRIRQEQAA